MAAATQTRFDLQVPGKDAFNGAPYLESAALGMLGDQVREKYGEHLQVLQEQEIQIAYVFKASGGTHYGRPLFANCQLVNGLTRVLAGRELKFVISFSADHLRELKVSLTEQQYEALMFRQLSRIGVNENTDSVLLRDYDFQGYEAELEIFGAWERSLQLMANKIQPGLFEIEDEDEEGASESATSDEEPNEEVSASNVVPFEVDEPRNGRPHSEADQAAEAAPRSRGRGAE